MTEEELISEFTEKTHRYRMIAKMAGYSKFNPDIKKSKSIDEVISNLSRLSFSELNILRQVMIGDKPIDGIKQ
jgi:hypothetical protein